MSKCDFLFLNFLVIGRNPTVNRNQGQNSAHGSQILQVNSANLNWDSASNVALKKYVLAVPSDRKNLNTRLGVPEFYPIGQEIEPEELINEKTIQEGFQERQIVDVSVLASFFVN